MNPTLSIPNVAGTVTLYNSDEEVLRSIGTYIHQVQKLYVVDNSEQPDARLIETIRQTYPTAEYINNGGNKGIAFALNAGAQAAIRDGFAYLLLMDDDSRAPSTLVADLLQTALVDKNGPVGIVSAQSDPSITGTDVQVVPTAITSGSLLSLAAYQSVGPFLNELFIDWVDHEYCFRLRQRGFVVLTDNRVRLEHRLGIMQTQKVWGVLPISWRSHNPVRFYYKVRNSLYVMNRYGAVIPASFRKAVYYDLLKDLVSIATVEKEKNRRLSYFFKAIRDGQKGQLGPLTQ